MLIADMTVRVKVPGDAALVLHGGACQAAESQHEELERIECVVQ